MSAVLLDAQPVPPGASLPARAEGWLGHAIEVPAAALVVGEVVVLLAGVIMRYVFDRPLPWADELASILFLWLANLGAAVALRRGTHMRTTALVSRWSPRAQAWGQALAVAAPCLMLVILIGPMTDYARDQWVVQTPALSWPDTFRAAAVPVGGVFMIAISLLRLARLGTRDLAGVAVAIAALAGALYLGSDWLQAIGNWNLVIFF
ncbi:MAG: TRAP transporter small permease, partial [Burkholderiales bacterium]|nr:TRAP transporter small permease [Burkholderiales bacterium]